MRLQVCLYWRVALGTQQQAAEENVCLNRAVMVKGKVVPMLVIKAYGGVEVQLHSL